jgi:hypothetical protein
VWSKVVHLQASHRIECLARTRPGETWHPPMATNCGMRCEDKRIRYYHREYLIWSSNVSRLPGLLVVRKGMCTWHKLRHWIERCGSWHYTWATDSTQDCRQRASPSSTNLMCLTDMQTTAMEMPLEYHKSAQAFHICHVWHSQMRSATEIIVCMAPSTPFHKSEKS